VDIDNWADDYTIANYLIVSRTLLGLYKARDKDYVMVPTQRMTDEKDVVRVENIYAPHVDVDGSPNFYWFEYVLPKVLKDYFYVPGMTCFYSSLRKLSVEDFSMNGTFQDTLDDNTRNTWEAVLGGGDQTKRDWVMSFYESATGWDGTPLWPQQMTDFSTYWKQDEWDDHLEYAIAFHLIGAHRLESGSWDFKDVGGAESVTLPFRLPLNSFSAFAVRQHFGSFGADLYFSAEGLPVLIQTPDGRIVARGDKDWQYWKFVWRSTLVTGITLVDHLHFTHFRAGNILSKSVRAALPPDSPARRVMSIFTFGTIFVNIQAMHQLVGPNHMLHRATPFKDFSLLSKIVPEANAGIIKDIPHMPGIKELVDDNLWEALHPKLREAPYFADGRLLVQAFRKLVYGFYDVIEGEVCNADGGFSDPFMAMKDEMLHATEKAHYKGVEAMMPALEQCSQFQATIRNRTVAYFFTVTGFHRHVGFVGDYYSDPSLATMSWKAGETSGRPRQHMIMTLVNVFTSTRQPLLKEDYSHLFKGMQPNHEEVFTKLWRNFQQDLLEIEQEIDRRNKGREIVNINMSPRVLESAVSK